MIPARDGRRAEQAQREGSGQVGWVVLGLLAALVAAQGCRMTGSKVQPPLVLPSRAARPATLHAVAEADRQGRSLFGPRGGLLTVFSGNGTRLTLWIPSGALEQETEITLQPVQALEGLPLQRGLVAAVQLQPEGLQLQVPASLSIEVPWGINPVEVVGFAFRGEGGLQLYPLEIEGLRMELALTRLGGFGAAGADPRDLLDLPPPADDQSPALHELALLWEEAQADGREQPRPETLAEVLRRWYGNRVRLLLARGGAATTLPPLEEAGLEYIAWLSGVRTASRMNEEAGALLEREVREARSLVAQLARNGIRLSNRRCLLAASEQETFAAAARALVWQQRAERWGVALPDHRLDTTSVLDQLCLKVVFKEQEGLSFPERIRPGEQGELQLQVGHEVRGHTPRFSAPLKVVIVPHGSADPRPITVLTDASGRLTAPVRWAASAPELRLDIKVCLPGAELEQVCQEAYIVRGTPSGSEGRDPDLLEETEEEEPGTHPVFEPAEL